MSKAPPPPLPKIKELKMTCWACPSQWEGMIGDQPLYVRYRWGHLTASYGVTGEQFFETDHGDPMDGYMSTEEMLELTGLEMSNGVTCENDW